MRQTIGLTSIRESMNGLRTWEQGQRAFSKFFSNILFVKTLPPNIYDALELWQSTNGTQFAYFLNSGLRSITFDFFQRLKHLNQRGNME